MAQHSRQSKGRLTQVLFILALWGVGAVIAWWQLSGRQTEPETPSIASSQERSSAPAAPRPTAPRPRSTADREPRPNAWGATPSLRDTVPSNDGGEAGAQATDISLSDDPEPSGASDLSSFIDEAMTQAGSRTPIQKPDYVALAADRDTVPDVEIEANADEIAPDVPPVLEDLETSEDGPIVTAALPTPTRSVPEPIEVVPLQPAPGQPTPLDPLAPTPLEPLTPTPFEQLAPTPLEPLAEDGLVAEATAPSVPMLAAGQFLAVRPLTIRACAAVDCAGLAKISEGEPLLVTRDFPEGGWAQVRLAGSDTPGFVFGGFLKDANGPAQDGFVDARQTVSDCPVCPEMTPIRRTDSQGAAPTSNLSAAKVQAPFLISSRAITRGQWWACATDGVCAIKGPRPRTPQEQYTVLDDLSGDDIKAFMVWLSAKSGQVYRVPSETELADARAQGRPVSRGVHVARDL